MRLAGLAECHLSYCTNIHPGEDWQAVLSALQTYLPAVKARLAPGQPFGVGLRLAAAAADALADPHVLADLHALLVEHGLYVFTVNGFPYGRFHGAPVKETVYLPDWSDPERLRYTNRLADILGALLPDTVAYGSISSVPGAFRLRATPDAVTRMVEHLLRHAVHLVRLRQRLGRDLVLALEPEPACFLETVKDAVGFFQTHLHGAGAVARLAELSGLSPSQAEEALHRHLGVCLDSCHAAVEFEEPDTAIGALEGAGIPIAKLQLSSGLRIEAVDADRIAALEPFRDPVYLHQTVERSPAGMKRYLDLPQAIAAYRAAPVQAREWRVHFHVPVFLARMARFGSTQDFLAAVLRRHRHSPVSAHLEVETYTWDVLPSRYRQADLVTSIAREIDWVRVVLEGAAIGSRAAG